MLYSIERYLQLLLGGEKKENNNKVEIKFDYDRLTAAIASVQ